MSESVTGKSYARAGLLGNPSDGYQGKTIALALADFSATVTMTADDRIRIVPPQEDKDQFDSIDQMLHQFRRRGLYGGSRLIKAALLRFFSHVRKHLPSNLPQFSLTWQSDIPRCVGLAGSSAIITASFKALCQYYRVDIEPAVVAALALQVETDILKIPAGPQDRVVQMLEGVVFMDFGPEQSQLQDGMEIGRYEYLNIGDVSDHLYLAWTDAAAEPTEVLHNNLRERFDTGETAVVDAMDQFAQLAQRGKHALLADDLVELGRLIDANFDLRASICRLPQFHRQMVETARAAGGTAKFCGSGGAIIGTFADAQALQRIREQLNAIGCHVLQPTIGSPGNICES
ncbi:MAG: mevalonate kinase family protein [Pirellulaceae bacterium]